MLLIRLLCFIFLIFYVAPFKEYGQFDLRLIQLNKCRGPKRKNCCETNVEIFGDATIKYNLFVKENVAAIKGKILASSNGKEVLRLQMNKPCNHIFLRPLMKSFVNVTESCVILKGHYSFTINIEELARNYYGGYFLYGNWTYNTVFYNDDCNFTCGFYTFAITPKNKNYHK